MPCHEQFVFDDQDADRLRACHGNASLGARGRIHQLLASTSITIDSVHHSNPVCRLLNLQEIRNQTAMHGPLFYSAQFAMPSAPIGLSRPLTVVAPHKKIAVTVDRASP